MAGKHQHHVWQFFQRGFGVKRGKHHHVWIYEKGLEPRQTSTYAYGAEDNFYATDGNNAADDVITEFENGVQSYLQELRISDDGTVANPAILAPVVSHLEIRSLFLRQEASLVVNRLVTALANAMSDPKKMTLFVRAHLEKNPQIIKDKLDELCLGPEDRKLAEAAVEIYLGELLIKEAPKLAGQASNALREFLSGLTDFAKAGQNKAILSGFSESQRTTMHLEKEYRLRYTIEDIILPDTGVAFLGDTISPISSRGDGRSELIIPLSSSQYIHGYTKRPTDRTSETIRSILAGCSYRSFVGRTSNLNKLCRHIGKNAKLISDREVEKMMRFENLLS